MSMRIILLLALLFNSCSSYKKALPKETNAKDIAYDTPLPRSKPQPRLEEMDGSGDYHPRNGGDGGRPKSKNGGYKDGVGSKPVTPPSPAVVLPVKPAPKKPTVEHTDVITEQTSAPSPMPPETTSGLLKYDVPPVMNFRETYTIRIRINRDVRDDEAIAVDMSEHSRTAVIRTSKIMEVTVTDPAPADRKNFAIVKSDEDGKQLVETTKGEFTEWIFEVTPLRTGKLKLNVVVFIIVEGARKQEVYFHQVEVRASAWSLFKHWWEKYWQWVMGAILIPIILMVVKKKIDQKKE